VSKSIKELLEEEDALIRENEKSFLELFGLERKGRCRLMDFAFTPTTVEIRYYSLGKQGYNSTHCFLEEYLAWKQGLTTNP
jgi:hypothetical protein